MKRFSKGLLPAVKLIILISFLALASGLVSLGVTSHYIRPFRVLLIIGTQWEDPASYLVEKPRHTGTYSGYGDEPAVEGDSDFHDLVVLLKSWGIPFDIIRLDQQLLDRYMFLDMHGNPRYGTIIWDVNISEKILDQDYTLVPEIIKEYGTGFIALSDRIEQPEIQSLLGLKHKGGWESNAPLEIKGEHFITKGLVTPFRIDSGTAAHIQRQQADLLEGTVSLVEQGSYPQVTVREYPSGSHLVWIGHDHNHMFDFQDMRTLFRRAITWTMGYNLYKTWEKDLIMIMDDPGGASNMWLEHWHYPVLSEEIIEKYLINPLLKNNAVLNINFVAGFVNEEKKRIEPAWLENHTDRYGTKQDYISSKKGYDRGVNLGVFEVMCHGLTHMQPDLVSDPVWYGASLDKEKSEVGWYREFGDTRRKGEIPAAEQFWRMRTASEWLKEQFGVVPLQFCPGGLGTSVSYFNNTAKLAGYAGFGWNGWETGYLGKDMAVTGWKYFGTPESPLMTGVLPDGHDFGISRKPEEFARIFDIYPDGRFMSINEFIGYLHSANFGVWDNKKEVLKLTVEYDPHYCRHFKTHSSVWNLELADWMVRDHGKPSSTNIDGNIIINSPGKINIPPGTGQHYIEIKF